MKKIKELCNGTEQNSTAHVRARISDLLTIHNPSALT